MLTILIFSLMFAHGLSRIDPRDYKCHVENASEISGSVSSLNIFLQAPGIAAAKGKLSRAQKVITHCISLQSHVQVNLLYLEKTRGGLTDQTAEKPTLKSLKVITSADGKPVINHTCVSTCHRKKFQRKYILRERVFLEWLSNCTITAKLPKLKVSAEGLTVLLHVHHKNQTLKRKIPCTNGKDMLNRQKLSIVFKVFIACILLAFIILYIMFVTYEITCLCLCRVWINSSWCRRSSPSADNVPVPDPTAALLTLSLKGTKQKPLKVFV